jgi:hypothetical protein
MLSELGAHPGFAGLTIFAIQPGVSTVSHDFQGGHIERAFWIGVAIWQLWDTCEAVARGMAWADWLSSEARPRYEASGPFIQEAIRRHRERNAAFE